MDVVIGRSPILSIPSWHGGRCEPVRCHRWKVLCILQLDHFLHFLVDLAQFVASIQSCDGMLFSRYSMQISFCDYQKAEAITFSAHRTVLTCLEHGRLNAVSCLECSLVSGVYPCVLMLWTVTGWREIRIRLWINRANFSLERSHIWACFLLKTSVPFAPTVLCRIWPVRQFEICTVSLILHTFNSWCVDFQSDIADLCNVMLCFMVAFSESLRLALPELSCNHGDTH